MALPDSYMQFDHRDSKTVISTTITKHNLSSYLKKKPDQCSKQELINETLRQLKAVFPNLPKPTNGLVEQNHHDGKRWVPNDNGFMITKNGFMDNNSKYTNLFTSGPHCGQSPYYFNSMESAVSNAVKLLHQLEPKTIKINKC